MKGVYVLLFKITGDFSTVVGSLGKVCFEKGNYAYVGSAQSSLFPRVERHFARNKRLHWHIDYLTSSTVSKIKGAIYASTHGKEFECLLGTKLSRLSFSKGVPNFGSTDCKCGCGSHLFKLDTSWKQLTSSTLGIFEGVGLGGIMVPLKRTR